MGKLTTEQAKKIMEAVKNAETNPIDDKFYPESKITTADKIDSGPRKKMPSVTGRMPKINRSFLNKDVKFEKPKPFNPKNVPEFKKPKPFYPNDPDRKTGLQYATGVNKYSKGSKKPIKAVAGVLAGLAAGVAPGIIGLGMLANKKMKKKSAVAEPNDEKYAMNDKSPIVDLYQKATGPAKMRTGGDVVIGKGGDYIKDLID